MRPVGTVLTKNKARTSCHDLGPVRTVVNKMTGRNTQQCEVKKTGIRGIERDAQILILPILARFGRELRMTRIRRR